MLGGYVEPSGYHEDAGPGQDSRRFEPHALPQRFAKPPVGPLRGPQHHSGNGQQQRLHQRTDGGAGAEPMTGRKGRVTIQPLATARSGIQGEPGGLHARVQRERCPLGLQGLGLLDEEGLEIQRPPALQFRLDGFPGPWVRGREGPQAPIPQRLAQGQDMAPQRGLLRLRQGAPKPFRLGLVRRVPGQPARGSAGPRFEAESVAP